MTCHHHLERDESIDSIKWYKDGKEFYRNVFSTSNDRDRVISYNISGTNSLDPQLSCVSYRNIVIIINEDSLVGAGSVITKNVKKKSLALTSSPQFEVKNY